MHGGVRHHVMLDQLIFLVRIDMVFVAVMFFIVLLRPARLNYSGP
jgi:hypothetical protein